MPIQENRIIVHRFYGEVVNAGRLDLVDELVSPDFVEHFAPPQLPQGSNGLKQFLTMLRNAFPDLQGTVDDMMADDDKIIARLTLHGTHLGPFYGIAATGKSVNWPAIHILRVEDSMIVERWALADVISIMQQIGAISAPGQPGR